MVNVAFAIPYREADERRQELFEFVNTWLRDKHPLKSWKSVYAGVSPDGPFNRGAAINDAARKAGDDWDVLVVHDADNICDPEELNCAVAKAHKTGKVHYPFQTYTYLDEYSSNRLLWGGSWFVAPEIHPQHGFRTTVRHKHCSGIQVIPRAAWEAVGGFVELTGWGAEDAIMNAVFDVFASGSEWLHGAAFHLWHPANRNDPRDQDNVRNHKVWSQVSAIVERAKLYGPERTQRMLRQFLATEGYKIP